MPREPLRQLHGVLELLPKELGFEGYADVDRNRRSVHVYLELEDFHFDVVPCIAPDGFDEPICVPDWGYKRWIESFPLGVVDLVEEMEASHAGKFRNVTKLLKHFRNTHMIYMQPKSYWLVAMAIDAVRSDSIDTTQPLAVVFNELINCLYTKFYPKYVEDGVVPKVVDPMLGHNVAWNWERHDFTAFMNRLSDGIGWSGRALEQDDKGQAIKLWQKIFGSEFETNVDDYAKSIAAVGRPGTAHASSTGLILPGASGAASTPVPHTRYYGASEE